MIYLASKSARRRDLLKQLGVAFEELRLREAPGRTRDVVEESLDGEPAAHYVERIARTKASVGWQRMEQRGLIPYPVLGADTEVVQGDEIFGKPRDAAHAAEMLRRLSGRHHDVLSGVALKRGDEILFALSVTRVTFRPLSERRSSTTSPPASRWTRQALTPIQGRAGGFATRLDGSYSGVMGSPLFETADLLAKAGVPVL